MSIMKNFRGCNQMNMSRRKSVFTIVMISSLVFGLLGCRSQNEEDDWGGTRPPSDTTETGETEPPRDHMELSLDMVRHISSNERDFELLFFEWEESETVTELIRMTKDNPIELDLVYMDDYALAGELPFELPSNDVKMTVYPNDVVLFEGNKILICYEKHTGNYTLLTHGKGQAGDMFDGGVRQFYKEVIDAHPGKMRIEICYY